MLQKVSLHNYRNLSRVVELADISVVVAPNGRGKTNLLESVYFSNFARIFRPIDSYRDLVGGVDQFARAEFQWDDSNMKFVISIADRVGRRFEQDDKRLKLAEVRGLRNVILFAPQMLEIVAGEPSVRRADLDDYLISLDQDYADTHPQYQRILKNRNALLRMARDGKQVNTELDHFTAKLVDAGEQLYETRARFFKQVRSYVAQLGADLFGEGSLLEVEYLPNWEPQKEYVSELISKYAENRSKEIVVGSTLYGVHKDDYQFRLSNQPLRYMGSRGQQRMAGLVFKLAQLRLLKEENQKETLLLLDDIFSELDPDHRLAVWEVLVGLETQTIITTSDSKDIPESADANYIEW